MKSGTLCRYLSAVVLAGFSLGAFADVKENPYQVIIDRNPFGLKPIPPPAPAPVQETPAPPPVEIKLTGISTLSGPPKVFLELVNTQTKKRELPRPLGVDDEDMGIRILAVDPEKGIVRVRNGDAETTLDFDKNGIKPAATASATPVPPPGGLVPLPVPTVPVGSAATTSLQNNSGLRGAVVAGGNISTPAFSGATPANAVPTTTYSGGIPPRTVRTPNEVGNLAPGNVIVTGGPQSAQPRQPVVPAPPPLSATDAAARIEAQRQMLLQSRDPGASVIMPPTEFSPPGAPGL